MLMTPGRDSADATRSCCLSLQSLAGNRFLRRRCGSCLYEPMRPPPGAIIGCDKTGKVRHQRPL